MKDNTPNDLIKAYLKGTLSGPERENFETSLAGDPDLAEAVALGRAEMAAAELLIAAETRAMFQEWQHPRRAVLNPHTIAWLAPLAASILLLFAATWLFYRLDGPPAMSVEQTPPPAPPETPVPTAPSAEVQTPAATPAPENPAQRPTPKNYRAMARQQMPAPLKTNLRKPASDSIVSAYQRAQTAYAEGDYRRTLDLLAQVDSARIQSATFLAAHALFRMDRFEEAENEFARLLQWKSRQYRYDSEWGLLMCRLADFPRRKNAVWQQLDDILNNPEHPYFPTAQALKKTLKE